MYLSTFWCAPHDPTCLAPSIFRFGIANSTDLLSKHGKCLLQSCLVQGVSLWLQAKGGSWEEASGQRSSRSLDRKGCSEPRSAGARELPCRHPCSPKAEVQRTSGSHSELWSHTGVWPNRKRLIYRHVIKIWKATRATRWCVLIWRHANVSWVVLVLIL